MAATPPERSALFTPWRDPVSGAESLIHPHPQFCLNDRYICYTTNVLGRVDVALTPVEAL